jgi:hypothetical protein
MSQSIRGTQKKRGRPKTTGRGTQIQVRIHDRQLAALDAFIASHTAEMSRPEAIRQILDDHLTDQGFLNSPKPSE